MAYDIVYPQDLEGATLNPQVVYFMRHVFVSALVCLEGRPGAAGALPREVADARRRLTFTKLDARLHLALPQGSSTVDILEDLAMVFGTALNLSYGDALHLFAPSLKPKADDGTKIVVEFPAEYLCVFEMTVPEGDKRRLRNEALLSDPFLGPLCRKFACGTCGLLPGKVHEQFLFCSLCRDPAAGRFCCKEPCFAAFWKGGHKKECAGRDKLKKRGEGK
jgi:hypothetical protein